MNNADRNSGVPASRSRTRGIALIDLVLACSLVSIVAAIAVPTLQALRERDAVRMAGRYLADRMQVARVEALKRNTTVALRFDPADVGRIGAFVDGDGDGVLQRDVDAGVDVSLGPELRIADHFDSVRLQIASDVPDPDGAGSLTAGSDPIRIGSSNFLSFGPLGSATSGSIYLAGRAGTQVCVRILGATGRWRVLWFDRTNRAWRQD